MTESVVKITTDADAVQEAILPLIKEVLGADCEEATKRAALDMIGRVVKVENVSFMNSNFAGDKVVNMDSPEE